MKPCPFHLVAAIGSLLISGTSPAQQNTAANHPAQRNAKVQERYAGDDATITTTTGAARFKAVMQDLEGEATCGGLWLTSTADEDAGKPNRFRVKAVAVGRAAVVPLRSPSSQPLAGVLRSAPVPPPATEEFPGTTMPNSALAAARALPVNGIVRATQDAAVWLRPGLVEEYTVSTDGVRQDFVVLAPPQGEGGALAVDLEITGARAEAAVSGVKLIVVATGRELSYSRLYVTDASGRELTARLDVVNPERLRVVVEDERAVYPVRIDPTFSDADWSALGMGISGGNAEVYAMAATSSILYVGGAFTTAGGVDIGYGIAQWNGSNWSPLGAGMNGSVNALVVSGSDLYAAGFFTLAGGVSANRIAKWNGTSWSALGAGMNAGVRALAVSGGTVYAGGNFTTAGGVNANNVARWTGSSWSALGSGWGNEVEALAVSGSDLYVGGWDNLSGYISKWNGSTWSPLGSGLDWAVKALAVSGTDLYAAGYFTTAGGNSANYIAKWNGTSWSALGSGLNGWTYALAVSGTDVYAGGAWTNAGGVAVSCVAKWNGSAWSALGSGLAPNYPGVRSLVVSGSNLYAGGYFTTAGGKTASKVARANLNGSTVGPEIRVFAGLDASAPELADAQAAAVDFGNTLTQRTFSITNAGTAQLTGLAVSKDGSGDFTILTQPAASVGVGSTTTFTVQFSPSSAGAKSGALHLASNDADENPFDIPVTGTGSSGSSSGQRQWVSRRSNSVNRLNAVTYGAGMFVAGGANGTIVTSPDGINWTLRSTPTTGHVSSLGYGFGLFVAGIYSAGNNDFMTSADGVNWTLRQTYHGNGNYAYNVADDGVAFGNSIGVAVGTFSDGNGIARTLNGTSWLSVNNGGSVPNFPGNGEGIVFVPSAFTSGKFFACHLNGHISSSTDGINWTLPASSGLSSDDQLGIAAGNGIIVSVGSNRIFSSSNGGTSFVAVDNPSVAGGGHPFLNEVAFGDNAFVAVSNSGSIWSSADGINWASDGKSANGEQLEDIEYGNGTFVTVGRTGNPDGQAWIYSSTSTPLATPAQMTSPAPGTLSSGTVTFAWDTGSSVSNYSLWIGTSSNLSSAESYNLHNAGLLTNIFSRTVTNLPTDGRTLFVTLWSQINGVWQSRQYTYTAYTAPGPVKAKLLTPTPGTALGDGTVTFTWDAGVGSTAYSLWVGTSPLIGQPGSYNLHNAGLLNNIYTRTVTTIPFTGAPVYVTLFTYLNGVWQPNQYTFTAPVPAKARMITPAANGSALGSSHVTFAWDAGRGATAYSLWVGNTPGAYDLHNAGLLTTRTTTVTFPGDGRKVHVTLWSFINNVWQASKYYYLLPVDATAGKALLTSPVPDATLTSGTVTFDWSPAAGSNVNSLWVGTEPGISTPAAYNLANAGLLTNQTSTTVTLPTDGRDLYVSLWTRLNNVWQAHQYRYRAWSAPGSSRLAELAAPPPNSVLAGATTVFHWTGGNGVTSYSLWIGTSPDTSSPECYNLHNAGLLNNATLSRTASSLPVDGSPIYVTLWTLINGTWQYRSYAYTTARLIP